MKKIESIVEKVLNEKPMTRSDDFLLIYEVYKEIHPNASNNSFSAVMKYHKAFGLPSFHTITRNRRKVFEKNPHLKPLAVTKKRKELEEEYKEYSRS